MADGSIAAPSLTLNDVIITSIILLKIIKNVLPTSLFCQTPHYLIIFLFYYYMYSKWWVHYSVQIWLP